MGTATRQPLVPPDLSSPQTKLVYLSLETVEEPTASELHERLGMPKLTLLSVLDQLVAMGHVERTADGYEAV